MTRIFLRTLALGLALLSMPPLLPDAKRVAGRGQSRC